MLRTGEAVVPMGISPQLPTQEHHSQLERLMVLTEHRVREGSMGLDQGVPQAGLMGVTGGSLMEDIMDTLPLQVTMAWRAAG